MASTAWISIWNRRQIGAANNKTVLPAALKKVKDYYAAQGKNFIISMAPEFPYLRENGTYLDYINALEGYYDFIAPQYYNQGGDGLWVEEIKTWLTQNDDTKKEDFLYYLTESLVTGTRGYAKIPAAKFVIGLPSNNDAAATGYVIDKQAVYNAFSRLDAKNLSIKGPDDLVNQLGQRQEQSRRGLQLGIQNPLRAADSGRRYPTAGKTLMHRLR